MFRFLCNFGGNFAFNVQINNKNMIEQIKNKIHQLVLKYEQERDYYRTSRFNETQVRNEFLDPLFEILGWDIRNISGKNTNEREVLLEESLKADASTHSKKPDYTFRLYGERKFFLEAKKPCVDIKMMTSLRSRFVVMVILQD